jgi:hypothetical protein
MPPAHPTACGETRSILAELRPGLVMHAFEGVDEAGDDVEIEMPAGISLSLVLDGAAQMRARTLTFRSAGSARAPPCPKA